MTEMKDEIVEKNSKIDETQQSIKETIRILVEEMKWMMKSVGRRSLKKMQSVEELNAKLEEEENKRLRLLADYENFKRRASLDKEAVQKYQGAELL